MLCVSILATNTYQRFCGVGYARERFSRGYGKELRLGRLIFPIRVVERLRQMKGLTLGGMQVWRAR